MTLTIRQATEADYTEAGAATAKAYASLFDMSNPDLRAYTETIADLGARAETHVLFVAEYNGELIGSCSLALESHQAVTSGAAHIRMLGVAPQHEGVGAGRGLVQACIDRSREAGNPALGLRTTAHMQRAQHLYEKLGFKRDPGQDSDDPDWGTFLAYRLDL